MSGTNYNTIVDDNVLISLTNEENFGTTAECVGDPNVVATQTNKFTTGCIMRRTDVLIGNNIYSNTGTLATPSWTLLGAGGGTPALPNNSIQYNNAGAFGGDSEAVRDPITHATSIGATLYVVDFPVFTGVGLNDIQFNSGYTGAPGAVYTITISATGVPDSFSWTNSLGGSGGPTLMTGGAYPLNDGVEIDFFATTGHTLGDSWTATVIPITSAFFEGNSFGNNTLIATIWSDATNNITGINGFGNFAGTPDGGIFGLFSFGGGTSAGINVEVDVPNNISRMNLQAGFAGAGSQIGLHSTNGITFSHQPGGNYTFPNVQGAANTVLTDVLGNGIISWQPAGGSLARPVNQIVYGTGASVTSDANFTWDTATFLVSPGGVNKLSIDATTQRIGGGAVANISINSGTGAQIFSGVDFMFSQGGNQIAYFKPGTLLASLGDINNTANRTKFIVDDTAKTITGLLPTAGGIFSIQDQIGNPYLYVNTAAASRTYALGDFNATHNATGFKADDNAGTAIVGDIFGNNTKFIVNKTANTLEFSKGTSIVFTMDTTNLNATLGDIGGIVNGTTFNLDDSTKSIFFNNDGIVEMRNVTGTSISFIADIATGFYGMGDTLQVANGNRFFIFDSLNTMDFQCKGLARFGDVDSLNNNTVFTVDDAANRVFVNKPFGLKGYTVATLPAGVTGDTAYVTDATAANFGLAPIGGGAVVIPVFFDGVQWIIA